MNYKTILIILTLVSMNKHLNGQNNQYAYDSQKAKMEIEAMIAKFKPLIDKLPTYKTYSPAVFTLNNMNEAEMVMINEENSPKDINQCRIKYSKMFDSEKLLSNKKLIIMCFLEKVLNPISNKTTDIISIYVEHLDESTGYVYCYPYTKSVFGKIKLDENLNFRKSIEKIMLIK